MKKHFLGIFVGIIALVAGGVSYAYGLYYSGKGEAYYDLIKGSYHIRVAHKEAEGILEYKEILSREYGVELVDVAEYVDRGEVGVEVISYESIERLRGYNEVMEAAIERRHGRGILERVWQRAQQEFEHRTKDEKQ